MGDAFGQAQSKPIRIQPSRTMPAQRESKENRAFSGIMAQTPQAFVQARHDI